MQSISLEPWIEQQMSLPSMLMRDQAYPTLWVIVMDPFFIARDDAMQKTLSFLPFKQLFTSKKSLSPFNVSRFQFRRWKLFLEFWMTFTQINHVKFQLMSRNNYPIIKNTLRNVHQTRLEPVFSNSYNTIMIYLYRKLERI